MEEQIIKDVEYVNEETTIEEPMVNEDEIQEAIRNATNNIALEHIKGLDEILALEEVMNISKEYNLNTIGLINALCNKLNLMTGGDTFNTTEDEVAKIVSFIDATCIESNQHPIDVCFKYAKVLSDMLIQLTVIENLNNNNSETTE